MTRNRLIAAITGGVAAIVIAVVGGVAFARSGEVPLGVTVDGVDVGGLGEEDARARLAEYAQQRSGEQVVLTDGEDAYPLDPVELGAAVDVDEVVDLAFAAGRDGTFATLRTNLVGTDVDIDPTVAIDREAVTAAVAEVAASVDTEVAEGAVRVDPVTTSVVRTDPVTGREVLVEDNVEAVVRALASPGADELELVVEETPSATDVADVDAAEATLVAAVAESLTLTSADGRVTLSPREIAPLVTSRVTDGADATIQLVVTPAAVEEHLVPLADPLLRTPIDASFEAPRRPGTSFDDQDDATWRPVPASVAVIPGRNGTTLDPEVAAEQLTRAVRETQREVAMELPEEPPAFSTQDAEAADVDTLLSTFTTYHACCQGRVTNIQRLADTVDGTVVLPGEQFSINQLSGVRECADGYAAAGMILNGEIVDVCGGGVSQFGTTTVNAVFFAGLDPDAYKPHSFYISRYPMAREATLNYPSPDIDVRFTNDTGAPIIVRTSYTGTSITVSFYGNSDVTEVRADVGSPSNFRQPERIRRTNFDLPAGSSRTVQSGQEGFSVGLTRTVVRGGQSSTDDWSNTYVAKDEIVEYNPNQPAPRPSPEPEPEPSPDPPSGS